MICEEDEDGQPKEDACQDIVMNDEITVVGEDPRDPLWPSPPPEPDPTPEPDPDPDPPPTPTPTPTPSFEALGTLADKIDCRGWNIDAGDRFGAPRPGGNHSGLDIQTDGPGAFRAPAAGTVSRPSFPDNSCGWPYTKLTLEDGSYFVFCHVSITRHTITGEVAAGDIIAHYDTGVGNDRVDPDTNLRADGTSPGTTGGPHMHIKYRERQEDGSYLTKDPVEVFGGEDALEEEGFSFDENDPGSCSAPEGGE